MIEKMKFLSITGPKDDIDRFIEEVLSKHEIQLESTLSELKNVKNLHAFSEPNPYKNSYLKAKELAEIYTTECSIPSIKLSNREASDFIASISTKVDKLRTYKDQVIEKAEAYKSRLSSVEQFIGLNYDLSQVLHFKYIKFRFGKITKEYFGKFSSYVYDELDSIFYKCQEDGEYVWGVYFVPKPMSDKVDAIYSSMHFERFWLPDEYTGTPKEAAEKLKEKIRKTDAVIAKIDAAILKVLKENDDMFHAAYKQLSIYVKNFGVRKLAACTMNEDKAFYILCGWMSSSEAKKLKSELSNDPDTFCLVEKDHSNIMSKPPTKLINISLFKPFEMFVEMYGLPAYNELDPTTIVAITYAFFFGFMFGDLGQGLVLLFGGAILYKLKGIRLAAIVSRCGFFSSIFGLLFGSVFGFEDIIEPIWLRPASATMTLPFIGSLNTVFIISILIGMGILLLTMVLNIINCVKSNEIGESLFDTNGVAGIVFYGAAIITIVLFFSGNVMPAGIILIIMFVLPLLVIFLKEPLTALIEKHAKIMPDEKGMFFVQGFFELFEVLLSYFSNTLSFVRVGAFAVSHAAMMEVVFMLAGAESGSPNWIVVIIGNLFVMGMEGLIVGIQVLRLEYYELFSRFYHGSGRAFIPYGSDSIKN